MIFGFGTTIWTARCMGPYNLGISGVTSSVVGQLTLFVSLNLDPALVRELGGVQSCTDRRSFARGVIAFRSAATIAVLVVAWGYMLLTGVSEKYTTAAIAGSALLLSSANSGQWALQAGERVSASYRFAAIGSFTGFLISATLVIPGAVGGTDVAIQAIASGIATLATWVAIGAAGPSERTIQDFLTVYRIVQRHKTLILSGFVIYLYSGLDMLLIGCFGAVQDVGMYRAALGLVGPVQSFLSLVPLLLYPRLIAWYKVGGTVLRLKQYELLRWWCIAAVCIATVGAIASRYLVPLLYGTSYSSAALPFSILLLAKLVTVASGFYFWGLLAMRRDRSVLLVTLLVAFMSVILNRVLIPHFGALGASIVNLLSESCIFALAFMLSRESRVCTEAGRK